MSVDDDAVDGGFSGEAKADPDVGAENDPPIDENVEDDVDAAASDAEADPDAAASDATCDEAEDDAVSDPEASVDEIGAPRTQVALMGRRTSAPSAAFSYSSTSVIDRLNALFEAADQNGDGEISRVEAQATGISQAAFAAMDSNNDGVVDYAEFARFVKEGGKDVELSVGGRRRSLTSLGTEMRRTAHPSSYWVVGHCLAATGGARSLCGASTPSSPSQTSSPRRPPGSPDSSPSSRGCGKRRSRVRLTSGKLQQLDPVPPVQRFKDMLLRRQASLACAWRRVLDPGWRMRLTQREFCEACRASGVMIEGYSLRQVYACMDVNGSGSITLQELDIATARKLAIFHEELFLKCGSMRSARDALGLTKGKTLNRAEFVSKCRALRLSSPAQAKDIFKLLCNDNGIPAVTDNELVWLDSVVPHFDSPPTRRLLPGESDDDDDFELRSIDSPRSAYSAWAESSLQDWDDALDEVETDEPRYEKLYAAARVNKWEKNNDDSENTSPRKVVPAKQLEEIVARLHAKKKREDTVSQADSDAEETRHESARKVTKQEQAVTMERLARRPQKEEISLHQEQAKKLAKAGQPRKPQKPQGKETQNPKQRDVFLETANTEQSDFVDDEHLKASAAFEVPQTPDKLEKLEAVEVPGQLADSEVSGQAEPAVTSEEPEKLGKQQVSVCDSNCSPRQRCRKQVVQRCCNRLHGHHAEREQKRREMAEMQIETAINEAKAREDKIKERIAAQPPPIRFDGIVLNCFDRQYFAFMEKLAAAEAAAAKEKLLQQWKEEDERQAKKFMRRSRGGVAPRVYVGTSARAHSNKDAAAQEQGDDQKHVAVGEKGKMKTVKSSAHTGAKNDGGSPSITEAACKSKKAKEIRPPATIFAGSSAACNSGSPSPPTITEPARQSVSRENNQSSATQAVGNGDASSDGPGRPSSPEAARNSKTGESFQKTATHASRNRGGSGTPSRLACQEPASKNKKEHRSQLTGTTGVGGRSVGAKKQSTPRKAPQAKGEAKAGSKAPKATKPQ